MKTLYPIFASLLFLIPFSPVGGYLWQQSQTQGAQLLQQTQAAGQQGWGQLSAVPQQLGDWWDGHYQQSQHYLAEQADACGEALAQSRQDVQQNLSAGGDRAQQYWLQTQQAIGDRWQSGQQSLQAQGEALWQAARDSGSQLSQSVEALFAADSSDDESSGSQSLAINDADPSPP